MEIPLDRVPVEPKREAGMQFLCFFFKRWEPRRQLRIGRSANNPSRPEPLMSYYDKMGLADEPG
jgi:hypothetical protein